MKIAISIDQTITPNGITIRGIQTRDPRNTAVAIRVPTTGMTGLMNTQETMRARAKASQHHAAAIHKTTNIQELIALAQPMERAKASSTLGMATTRPLSAPKADVEPKRLATAA